MKIDRKRNSFFGGFLIFIGFLFVWWLIAVLLQTPSYILPSPVIVAGALWQTRSFLWYHSLITLIEILSGFIIGSALGALLALLLSSSRTLQKWFMPAIIISQSLPIFALAPILVLWFGFGISSKIAATVLVIFFPVTTAFFDGLRRTETSWLELAKTMGASSASTLIHIKLIAALPSLGSGVRVAAAIAPIGAIIGEWVGSSSGLGFVMLNANARLQAPTCFAALFILAIIAIGLWKVVDFSINRYLFWVTDTSQSS